MKHIWIIGLMILLCGCSHHITSYSKGAGFEFAWQPDSFTPSIRAGFYEFLFSMNRENGNVRYTTNTGMGIGNDIFGIASLYSMITGKEYSSSTGSGTVLEIKTGPTMSGYVRDVLENSDINENHVKIIQAVHKVDVSLPNKETHVTPFKSSTNAAPVVKTEKGILGDSVVTTPVTEQTQEAIKKQINPNNIIDVVNNWGIYAIIGIISGIVLIIILITIFFLFKRKKQ